MTDTDAQSVWQALNEIAEHPMHPALDHQFTTRAKMARRYFTRRLGLLLRALEAYNSSEPLRPARSVNRTEGEGDG